MIEFKGVHHPKSVILHAVFFYVRTGETFAPRDLPDANQLEALLGSTAAGEPSGE